MEDKEDLSGRRGAHVMGGRRKSQNSRSSSLACTFSTFSFLVPPGDAAVIAVRGSEDASEEFVEDDFSRRRSRRVSRKRPPRPSTQTALQSFKKKISRKNSVGREKERPSLSLDAVGRETEERSQRPSATTALQSFKKKISRKNSVGREKERPSLSLDGGGKKTRESLIAAQAPGGGEKTRESLIAAPRRHQIVPEKSVQSGARAAEATQQREVEMREIKQQQKQRQHWQHWQQQQQQQQHWQQQQQRASMQQQKASLQHQQHQSLQQKQQQQQMIVMRQQQRQQNPSQNIAQMRTSIASNPSSRAGHAAFSDAKLSSSAHVSGLSLHGVSRTGLSMQSDATLISTGLSPSNGSMQRGVVNPSGMGSPGFAPR